MATYRKVPVHIPSAARTSLITAVVATDQIDITDILGRPARGIKIIPDDASDEIQVRYNNKVRIPEYYPASGWGESGREKPTDVEVVSAGAQHSIFTYTGSPEYVTPTGLQVKFIEIVAITFGSGGSAIQIEVW